MKRLIPLLVIILVLMIILPTMAQVAPTTTYYALQAARVRSCASTRCSSLGSLQGNEEIRVVSDVEGQKFNGSTVWRQFNFDGTPGYVHSSLLTTLEPGRLYTPGAPTPLMQSLPMYLPPLVTSVPSIQTYMCNGIDDLNCSNFSTQAEASAYLLLCGRDEDFLDANNDGYACEALPP